jgi:hypothetical protein
VSERTVDYDDGLADFERKASSYLMQKLHVHGLFEGVVLVVTPNSLGIVLVRIRVGGALQRHGFRRYLPRRGEASTEVQE